MSEEIILAAKPFSINAASYRDQRFKTTEYRNWASQIFHQLSHEENQSKILKIRELFDDSKHSVKLILTAWYPKEIFVTKAGTLSAKTIDITNWEKLLADLLFDAKFHEKPYPTGCPNFNINDKNIISLLSQKKISPDEQYYISIKVKIVKKPF